MRLQLITLALVLTLAPRIARADDPPDPPDDDTPELDPKELPHVEESTEPPITGLGRVGVYIDSDKTTVWRFLGTLGKVFGDWSVNGAVSIDAVSSASVDVRTSPSLGQIDAMTSASGQTTTSGGQMTDTRYQGTVNAGWKDGDGHAANATASAATENDYASISGGLNGSYDVLDRTTTLLAGMTLTDNWISSVIDPSLHHKMLATGWSAGIAHVLTPDDAVRLRYDGRLADGYQASPYRNVRFGDWYTASGALGQTVFMNTLGAATGMPEHLPELRIAHALTLEWVHSLAPGIGLHPSLRVGHDDWGISSVTPAIDLRIARPEWRLQLGYRFYAQTHASFFEGKYLNDPSTYASYTSDKELGRQLGHLVEVEYATVLSDAGGPNQSKMLWFIRVDAMHYSYPGFLLLGARASVFLESGLSWEL